MPNSSPWIPMFLGHPVDKYIDEIYIFVQPFIHKMQCHAQILFNQWRGKRIHNNSRANTSNGVYVYWEVVPFVCIFTNLITRCILDAHFTVAYSDLAGIGLKGVTGNVWWLNWDCSIVGNHFRIHLRHIKHFHNV